MTFYPDKVASLIAAKHHSTWHINQMLQQMSHDAADNGIFSIRNVDSWMIRKPARIWAVARRNHGNLPRNEFYKLCAKEGIMDRTGNLPDVLIECGAILTMEHENNQVHCKKKVNANDQVKWLLNQASIPCRSSHKIVYELWAALGNDYNYEPEEYVDRLKDLNVRNRVIELVHQLLENDKIALKYFKECCLCES